MPELNTDPKTCATCRHITYTRTAMEGPRDLFCENRELMQAMPTPTPGVTNPIFFKPPRLAFSCNRWLIRKPDLGFVPDFAREDDSTTAPKPAQPLDGPERA